MIKKVICSALILLLGFSYLFVPNNSFAGTPHIAQGNLQNSDGSTPANGTIFFNAYITTRTGEVISESNDSPSSGYQSGQWYVECGNFTSPWNNGEMIRVDIWNSANGETGTVYGILTNAGVDDFGTLNLNKKLTSGNKLPFDFNDDLEDWEVDKWTPGASGLTSISYSTNEFPGDPSGSGAVHAKLDLNDGGGVGTESKVIVQSPDWYTTHGSAAWSSVGNYSGTNYFHVRVYVPSGVPTGPPNGLKGAIFVKTGDSWVFYDDGQGTYLNQGWNVLPLNTHDAYYYPGGTKTHVTQIPDLNKLQIVGVQFFMNTDGTPEVDVDYYTADDILIPVELTTFAARSHKGKVTLNWTTQSETENFGFHIYRNSVENGDYKKINQQIIQGIGNSNKANTYTYTDQDVKAGNIYYYKLADVDFNGNTTFHGPISVTVEALTPAKYALEQSYPNPFNPETAINFSIKEAGKVSLKIYNLQGQVIQSLVDEEKLAGSYSIIWNGTNDQGVRVSSGTYLYTLKVNGFEDTKKLTFMK